MKYLAILTTLLLAAFLSDCGIASPVSTITPSPRPTQTIASDALTYLNNALDLIQEYSYYRKKVDWTAIRNEAYYIASGATTPAQTYGAINLVFRLIGDSHGRFNPTLYTGWCTYPLPELRTHAWQIDRGPFGIHPRAGNRFFGFGYSRSIYCQHARCNQENRSVPSMRMDCRPAREPGRLVQSHGGRYWANPWRRKCWGNY